MKSYNDYLYESVSTYNEYKQMPNEDLDDSIDSVKHLTYHHVRGMLSCRCFNRPGWPCPSGWLPWSMPPGCCVA